MPRDRPVTPSGARRARDPRGAPSSDGPGCETHRRATGPRLRRAPAGELLGDTVHQDHTSLDVRGDHAVGDAPERDREALFLGRERGVGGRQLGGAFGHAILQLRRELLQLLGPLCHPRRELALVHAQVPSHSIEGASQLTELTIRLKIERVVEVPAA